MDTKKQMTVKEMAQGGGMAAMAATATSAFISQPVMATGALDDLTAAGTSIGTLVGAMGATAVVVVGFVVAKKYFKQMTSH